MAANDVILSRIPVQNGEVTVKNTHASTALAPGMSCTVDTSNLLSATQPVIGVVPAVADSKAFGIVLENIAAGAYGRVACIYSSIVAATASGAITVGDSVECDTGSLVKTSAGSKPIVGDALTTTASSGDQVLLGIPGHAVV
jgi:hypothetical protein